MYLRFDWSSNCGEFFRRELVKSILTILKKNESILTILKKNILPAKL